MDQPIHSRTSVPPVRPVGAHHITSLPRHTALLVGVLLMVVGVLLRLPTASYAGLPEQNSFNTYIFQFVGAYSDITSLYFRDQLWNHPVPYLGYALEYPVGMGALIWLVGFINTGVMPYFLATALVMMVCGVAVFRLGERFDGANMWLLALSPTLPLYGVLNWDLFGILPTVAALWCFRRNRDGWGALLLAAAVWIKFFPIVLVPLVLWDRVLQRRWRDVGRIGAIVGLASVVINAPFALHFADGGVRLRDTWLHFFRFNQYRPREVNFWNFFDFLNLSLDQINRANTVLLALGVAGLLLLMAWSYRRACQRPSDVLLAASLAAIAWFFFINKVYSPQYSLWLAVFLALLAAPPVLSALFAAADVGWFAVSFIWLYLLSSQNAATDWFQREAMLRSMLLREAVIAAIIAWAIWRMVNNRQFPMNNEQTEG